MGIRHNYQSPTPNDGSKEVSSTRWNEDHVIDGALNLPPQASDPGTTVDGDIWTLTSGAVRVKLAGMLATLAIFGDFANRAAAVAWMTTEAQPDGAVITVAGLPFRKKTGATAIADMPDWLPARDIYADHFGENTTPGTTDMSAPIQAGLTYVGGLGGGELKLWLGTYIAAGLSCPNETYLVGQGIEATTLKLKNGANTWLLASSNYVNNQTFANLYGGTRDLTMDGNKANNATGSLVWFSSYRGKFLRTRFVNSGGAGLVLTAIMSGGALLANGMAENQVMYCHFDTNATHGVWAQDGAANRTSDAEITYNHMYGNGGAGIYAERCAGWKITHNQIYLNGTHCIYVNELARTVITGNHLDLDGSGVAAAGRAACVYVDVISTQGAWLISGNILLIQNTADTVTKLLHGLAIIGGSADPGLIGGNTYVDLSAGQGATPLYLGAAAAASLAKMETILTGLGPDAVLTRNVDNYRLVDQIDPTKQVQFDLGNTFPTGTTRTVFFPYFPGGDGTVAYRESNNTWYGQQTFDTATILLDTIKVQAGNGTPQGAVTAEQGSLYLRKNGAAGSTFYVKESGTGNTGWTAYGAPSPVQLTIPFSTPFMEEGEYVLSAPGVTAASLVTVGLVPNDDNDAGDLSDDGIQVFAIPETDQIRFVLTGKGQLVGPFTINYGVF